jgi:cytochrome P450
MESPASHSTVPALYGPHFQDNTSQFYQRIREEHGPVAPVLLEGDVPAWLVLGYRELREVTGNAHLFARTSRQWHGWTEVPDDWSLRPYVEYQPCAILSDAEEHQRLSPALHGALTEVDEIELARQIETISDRHVDVFAGRGEADLMAEYADPLPLLMLAKLFGFPDDDVPNLTRDVAISAQEGEEAVRAHERIVTRMVELVRYKRDYPGTDLPSRILSHPIEFSDEEIATDLFLTMGASQLTTTAWIGSALRLMLTDARFATHLTGGRRSVRQALNEVLWAESPCQNFIGRWAVQDCQLGGRRIGRGDLIVLGMAAANTDPLIGDRAAGIAADNQAHMAFGHGEHACPWPAQEIATTTAEVAIQVLLDRLPDVELAVRPEELRWRQSVWLRGLTALPVRFTPQAV